MIVSRRGVCLKYKLSATQETIFTTSMDDNTPSALSKRDFHTNVVTLPSSLCTVAGMDKRLISEDNSSPSCRYFRTCHRQLIRSSTTSVCSMSRDRLICVIFHLNPNLMIFLGSHEFHKTNSVLKRYVSGTI